MSLLPQRPKHLNEAAIWQDVEFGSYAADLPLWEELAAEATGTVVELGAGSGRVALHLARSGAPVVAIEQDAELAEELGRRAEEEELPLRSRQGDVTEPGFPEAALAIGPLQVLQLLDEQQRGRALDAIAAGLLAGGRLAVALVDESTLVESGVAASPPPDMREHEGWVYSSEALWVQVNDDVLRMRRLRERVSPNGDMVRKVHDDVLYRLTPDQLEAQASAAGLRPLERREIPSSAYEAGSTAVILGAP